MGRTLENGCSGRCRAGEEGGAEGTGALWPLQGLPLTVLLSVKAQEGLKTRAATRRRQCLLLGARASGRPHSAVTVSC